MGGKIKKSLTLGAKKQLSGDFLKSFVSPNPKDAFGEDSFFQAQFNPSVAADRTIFQPLETTEQQISPTPELPEPPPPVSMKMTEADLAASGQEARRKARRKSGGRAGTFIVPVGGGKAGLPSKVGGA